MLFKKKKKKKIFGANNFFLRMKKISKIPFNDSQDITKKID